MGGKTAGGNWQCAADSNNRANCLSYDAAGNVTANGSANYTYDAGNMLKTFSSMSYLYDADGKRFAKWDSGVPVKSYFYGANGEVLAEGAGSSNLTAEYIFFNGKRLARVDLPGNTIHYYLSDHLGSTSMVVSSTGVPEEESDFSPYGVEYPVAGQGANRYKYSGKERDLESQMDYFGARYYGNMMGRFLSADWSATPSTVPYAHLENPQTLNLYAYVDNNPINGIDEDGHAFESIVAPSGSWGLDTAMFDDGPTLETDVSGNVTFSMDGNIATVIGVQINSVTQSLAGSLSGGSDLQSQSQPWQSSTVENKTSTRKLSGYEKGKLNPFLPKVDLEKAIINIGKTPHYGMLRFPMPPGADAVTVNYNIFIRKRAYDPATIDGLGLLAHELFHVDQYRTGVMTPVAYLREALKNGGGMENKYESPAYAFESAVKEHLTSKGTAWDGSLIQ